MRIWKINESNGNVYLSIMKVMIDIRSKSKHKKKIRKSLMFIVSVNYLLIYFAATSNYLGSKESILTIIQNIETR